MSELLVQIDLAMNIMCKTSFFVIFSYFLLSVICLLVGIAYGISSLHNLEL